ncbi:MAG: DUF2017 family protein [Verrucomicrobiales bacterium]
MQIELFDPNTLSIREMPAQAAEILVDLPRLAASREDDAVLGRIYPKPSTQTDLQEDWNEIIRPELRELFQSAAEIVKADLTTISQDSLTRGFEVTFPRKHADAWLNCLNQVRIVMGTKINYVEGDALIEQVSEPRTEAERRRFQVIAQMDFYAHLQESIIAALDYVEGFEDEDEEQTFE